MKRALALGLVALLLMAAGLILFREASAPRDLEVPALPVRPLGLLPRAHLAAPPAEPEQESRDAGVRLKMSGTVVDVAGAAAAAVRVHAFQVGGEAHPAASSWTDDEGRFELVDLVPGDYRVVATTWSRWSAEGTVVAPAGRTGLRIALRAPAYARGRVVDASARPVAEFAVDGHDFAYTYGMFEVAISADTKLLRVTAPGFLPVEKQLPGLIHQDVEVGDVVIGEGREVRVVITSALSGRALRGATVQTLEAWAARDEPFAVSNASGVTVLRGLPASAVTYRINHETHRPQDVRIEAQESEKAVRLEKGPTLLVTVVDAEGTPVNADLAVFELDDPVAGQLAMSTEDGGTRRLEGMIPGHWFVAATTESRRAHREVALPSEGETRVELELVQGAARVLVQLPTAPPGWRVTGSLLAPIEIPLLDGMFGDLMAQVSYLGMLSADQQHAEFSRVAAGPYHSVVLLRSGSQLGWVAIPVQITSRPEQVFTTAPVTESSINPTR